MAAPTLKHLIARIRALEKAAVGLLAQGKAEAKESLRLPPNQGQAPATSKAEAPTNCKAKSPSKSKAKTKGKSKAPANTSTPTISVFVAAEQSGPEVDAEIAASALQIGRLILGGEA